MEMPAITYLSFLAHKDAQYGNFQIRQYNN